MVSVKAGFRNAYQSKRYVKCSYRTALSKECTGETFNYHLPK